MLMMLLGLAALAQAPGDENWVVAIDLWGTRSYQSLTLHAAPDGTLTGDLDGDAVTGRRRGTEIGFTATDSRGGVSRFAGRVTATGWTGEADLPAGPTGAERAPHAFTARRIPDRPTGGPRTHDFVPADYSNLFSADRAPVLTIWPGDTVRTSTVDSGGMDAQGRTRALFGNPQTGPFFIAGAKPGDTLVVRIDRLRTNRDWADSLDMIVGRAQSRWVTGQAADLGRHVRWRIDTAHGTAAPELPAGGHLAGYSVPLHPMLGGIAVAPPFGFAAASTGDTGRFGGNMDFNQIAEGSIVYLPVLQPGALLYLGDAHAAQGDGETSQFALETSMDVTFTVDVIHREIGNPRVETPTHLAAIGQAGTTEDAIKIATAGLIQWLQQDYALTVAECGVVLGSAIEYRVVTLAGQNVGMLAMLPKARLAGLARTAP